LLGFASISPDFLIKTNERRAIMLELYLAKEFVSSQDAHLQQACQQGYCSPDAQIALDLQDIYGELHEYYS
jgi:hypothetical protein